VPRDFTETRYAAQSWPRPRRVVARIEATLKGLDTRYVVTNIAHGSAQWLYGDVPHQTPDHDSLRHKQEHQKNRAVSFSEKRERPTTPIFNADPPVVQGQAGNCQLSPSRQDRDAWLNSKNFLLSLDQISGPGPSFNCSS
jgi:hypothetical protein